MIRYLIVSIVTPVFSVTWSFRNHSNMLILFYKSLYPKTQHNASWILNMGETPVKNQYGKPHHINAAHWALFLWLVLIFLLKNKTKILNKNRFLFWHDLVIIFAVNSWFELRLNWYLNILLLLLRYHKTA